MLRYPQIMLQLTKKIAQVKNLRYGFFDFSFLVEYLAGFTDGDTCLIDLVGCGELFG